MAQQTTGKKGHRMAIVKKLIGSMEPWGCG